MIVQTSRTIFYNFLGLSPGYKIFFFKPLLFTWCLYKNLKPLIHFLWIIDLPHFLKLTSGPGKPVWDWIWVKYTGLFLLCITCCSCINNKVNSESSGISSAVPICKTTVFVYWESVTTLRFWKVNRTMRIAYSSDFWNEAYGLWVIYLHLMTYNLPFLTYWHMYKKWEL